MSVHYTAGYASAAPLSMDHSRILWSPWVATPSSNGDAVGHPVSRVVVPDTSTWWETTVAVPVLTLAFGALRSVEAVGLAGHNLTGRTVLIEGATNVGLTTWTSLITVNPTDDSTILALFAAGNYYGIRITITGGGLGILTRIAVAYTGTVLTMPTRGYNDLGPVDLGMDVSINTYRTETGQIAGRFISYTGLMGNLSYTHLPEPWVRSTLLPFLKSAITIPFFIATRPAGYPKDCAYAWTTDNVIPQRMRLKNYMSIQMKVNAHAPASLF